MSKFILVDHSIVGLGGHHYEYAFHVLQAAEKAGYTPVLATNRRFKDTTDIPWEVYPIYTYGLWFRLAEPSWYQWFKQALSSVNGRITKLKVQLIFSPLGFFWSIRKLGFECVQWNNLTARQQVTFFLMRLISNCLNMARSLTKLLRLAMPFRAHVRRYFSSLKGFLKASLRRLMIPLKPKRWMLRWLYNRVRMWQFGKDSLKLFQRIHLKEGDIVFIPTISSVEMLGLFYYFSKDPNSIKATWHLLFRRNLYSGRDPDYQAQDELQQPIRNAFKRLQERFNGQKVYFYTDSEELTSQHNRLGVVPFTTLPIPHTRPPVEHPLSDGEPIKIIYAGDARAEKGYQHLPRIVQDLWEDYVRTGKVVFVFQSNYNNPEGEPEAIIARSQLECYPKDKVTLLKEPLSSEEYWHLLSSGGINLLLYKRDNYYARSSGILIESLTAGMPVIVPAGTWMARQFIQEIYRHHESLRQTMRVLESRFGGDIRWQRKGQPELNPMEKGELVFGSEKQKAYCWLSVPNGATHLLVSFKSGRNDPGVFLLIYAALLSAQEDEIGSFSRIVEKRTNDCPCTVLVPIKKGVRRIWLVFNNSFSHHLIRVSDIQIDFLSGYEPSQKCPLGAVGLTYRQPEEVSGLLREMINNYSHYRETARAFAKEVYIQHNAERLTKELRTRSLLGMS